MLGDINEDKIIDIQDFLLISRHIVAEANKNHEDWILKNKAFEAADVTRNSTIDSSDMLIILRYIAI